MSDIVKCLEMLHSRVTALEKFQRKHNSLVVLAGHESNEDDDESSDYDTEEDWSYFVNTEELYNALNAWVQNYPEINVQRWETNGHINHGICDITNSNVTDAQRQLSENGLMYEQPFVTVTDGHDCIRVSRWWFSFTEQGRFRDDQEHKFYRISDVINYLKDVFSEFYKI